MKEQFFTFFKHTTMKRLVLVFVSVLLVTATANAQFLRFGVKGGLNSSTMKIDETTLENISTTDGAKDLLLQQGNSELGLHVGLFARIKIASLFIQPEVLFSQSKGSFKISDQTNLQSTYNTLVEQKFNKFDIPVMVGWKFGPAKVYLGPVATFNLSEQDGLKDQISEWTSEPVENSINKAVFGYQAGVGLDIFKFATFDVKYEGNLSKFGEGVVIAGQERKFDQRNPQWIFSLGIFF